MNHRLVRRVVIGSAVAAFVMASIASAGACFMTMCIPIP